MAHSIIPFLTIPLEIASYPKHPYQSPNRDARCLAAPYAILHHGRMTPFTTIGCTHLHKRDRIHDSTHPQRTLPSMQCDNTDLPGDRVLRETLRHKSTQTKPCLPEWQSNGERRSASPKNEPKFARRPALTATNEPKFVGSRPRWVTNEPNPSSDLHKCRIWPGEEGGSAGSPRPTNEPNPGGVIDRSRRRGFASRRRNRRGGPTPVAAV